jgi:hypothetical protein
MNNETGVEEMKSSTMGKDTTNLPESPTNIILPKSRFTKKEKWFIVCVTAFVGLFRHASYTFASEGLKFNSTMPIQPIDGQHLFPGNTNNFSSI